MSPDSVTIRGLLAESEDILAKSPHPDHARLDAEILLLHVLHRSNPASNRAWLIAHSASAISSEQQESYNKLLQRRLVGEPIQYITGEVEFYGIPLYVSRDVLIPRPETEALVEAALSLSAKFPSPRIVDVGTGSGAIAIAIARNLSKARVTAADISSAALGVAQKNAERNAVVSRIRFLHGDLLSSSTGEQFELIVSNPPYVPVSDKNALSVEVREYEPHLALFADDDGLSIYRRLIPEAFQQLAFGGYLILEMGYSQSEFIYAMLTNAGFVQIDFLPDLQGILRIAIAQRP